MERFLARHEGRIKGILSGFDRLLFRGTLQSICHPYALDKFLSREGILIKEFFGYANKLSEQLKKHAEKMVSAQGRPFIYLNSSKDDKEKAALKVLEENPVQEGLICVLSCVESCMTFHMRGLQITKAERKCAHYYFYYLDREFGLMHVRLQTWFPFTVQVCLNGREYLARRLRRLGIECTQNDNCCTDVADFIKAQKILNTLTTRNWGAFLNKLVEPINPFLSRGAKPFLGSYFWTVRESEFAIDIIFKDPKTLEEIYPSLWQHALRHFKSKDVLRFLGRCYVHSRGEVQTNVKHRHEGVRIKHWVQENSIKMYDKAGCVLRIEVTINNPRQFSVRRPQTRNGKKTWRLFPLRRGIADIGRRVQICRAANDRYLDALAVVGDVRPSRQLLDPVSKPVLDGKHRHRALRPISPEDSRLFELVMNGEFTLHGFRNSDLRQMLFPSEKEGEARSKASGRVTRILSLFKAHGLIDRVQHSQRYRLSPRGQEIMATALNIREANNISLAA